MLATILYLAGTDPTIHIGGDLPLIGGSVYLGGMDCFVSEACEYKDSFLHFTPTCAVILNIDADHLDYFKNLDAISESFNHFADLLPADGEIIGNGDDPRVMALIRSHHQKAVTFGYDPSNDYYPINIAFTENGYAFDVCNRGRVLCHVQLSVPGKHNILNALAALIASQYCGMSIEDAAPYLTSYTGAGRRFQNVGSVNGANVYHDYAHHPTEISATISAARDLCKGKLYCIFQPHTYSRTIKLYDQFLTAFNHADALVLVDIYAAREQDQGLVSSHKLASDIRSLQVLKEVNYAPNFEAAAEYIRRNAQPDDLVLTLGAGDIERINHMICDSEPATI